MAMLSMVQMNQWWQNCYLESFVFKPFNYIFSSLREKLESKTANVGTFFQKGGLVSTCLLFLCLGLPQFANDKVGLALISIFSLGLWFAGWLLGGKEKRSLDIVDFLVILYLAINIVATFSSHYLFPSIKGLSKVIIYICSYFLFSTIASQSKRNSIILLGAAMLTGICLSLHGLYQYKVGVAPLATWEDPTVQTTGTRIFSTLGNPNLLAGFLIPIAPITLGIASYLANKKKLLYCVPIYIGFALIALATILTGSRGGYIALFASLVAFGLPSIIWLWNEKKGLRPYIVVFLIVAILGAVFALTQIPAFQTRLASIFAGREHSSNSYRLNVWESSFSMFKDNWWIGTGVGNEAFRLAYGLYMVSGYDALGTYCVPLEIAVECGLFGLIVFIALLGCLMARAHLIFWDQNSGPYRWIILGVAGAIVGLMTHGIVDTVFYRPQVHFIFWLLVGVLAINRRNSDIVNS